MTETIRRAKDRGAALSAQGKLKAALEQYEAVVRAAPWELGARQGVAEVLLALGRSREAVEHLELVAEGYARRGQFYKAAAVTKALLGLSASARAPDILARLFSASREPTPKLPPTGEPLNPRALAPPTVIQPEGAPDDGALISVAPQGEPSPEGGAALPTIPLFSELSPAELKAVLAEAVEVCVFADGQPIVSEGELGDAMYVVCQGQVSVERPSATGLQELARLGEGDSFGEIGLVFGAPRMASVVAKGEVVALELRRSAMEAVLKAHTGVGRALERFFSERLLANLLRASPVFEPLAAEAKAQLQAAFLPKAFEAGEVLVEQRKPSDGLYLLLRGTCEVLDQSGKRYSDLREGAHFGEISLMLDKPATATVRAATAGTALKLPASVFKSHVLAHPKVKELLVTLARERLERTSEMLIRSLNL